jgi:heme/copper-type cytochrome/quinol oxidase subunit 3
MIALPPAPVPAPRRQLLIGTSAVGAAITMLFGGMLAVWWRFRENSPLRAGAGEKLIKDWMPKGVKIPMVPVNVLFFTLIMACLMAQYAVYAAKRADRSNVTLGLGLTMLTGLAALNAQAYIWGQMKIGIRDGRFETMFYAVTGSFFVLMIVGLVFTVVAAFRHFGGRTADHEVITSHALFWYILTAIFTAVWFVVYVTK